MNLENVNDRITVEATRDAEETCRLVQLTKDVAMLLHERGVRDPDKCYGRSLTWSAPTESFYVGVTSWTVTFCLPTKWFRAEWSNKSEFLQLIDFAATEINKADI